MGIQGSKWSGNQGIVWEFLSCIPGREKFWNIIENPRKPGISMLIKDKGYFKLQLKLMSVKIGLVETEIVRVEVEKVIFVRKYISINQK